MSPPIDKLKVNQALEMVCQLGCVTVREVIVEIERGVLPKPAKKLTTEECERLLLELKLIMETYK